MEGNLAEKSVCEQRQRHAVIKPLNFPPTQTAFPLSANLAGAVVSRPVLGRRQQRTAERIDLRMPVVAPAECYAAEDGGGCGAVVDEEGDDVGFRAACELGRRIKL